MKILISGSHGFIGSSLHAHLRGQGHSLLRLIRPTQVARSDEVFWNPIEHFIERGKLAGVEAVIHLAGENLFGRWNEKKKQTIYDSRVLNTAFLTQTLAEMDPKPQVLICASAIGYYGDRGEYVRDKSIGGFKQGSAHAESKGIILADTKFEWESSTTRSS